MRPLSITRLSAMSVSQLRQIGEARPARTGRTMLPIALDQLSASQQYALVSWSKHPLCRQVASVLRTSSTVRDDHDDRATLRMYGLAEFIEGQWRHRLTPDGQAYALSAARQIARTLGLHLCLTDSDYTATTKTCTCGWRAHVSTRQFDSAFEAERAFLQHLNDVSARRT